MAEKRARLRATTRPTAFARAVLLDEAYSRLDAARRRARHGHPRDERERLRRGERAHDARGARARYDDACASGSRDRASGSTQVRERARVLDLVDEEARCSGDARRRATPSPASSRWPSARPRTSSISRERREIVRAAVDAWQTLAVVHQTRGELGAALDARRAAARAAQRRRPAGARGDADDQRRLRAHDDRRAGRGARRGRDRASPWRRRSASPGAVRHGQMILLCWAATFGTERRARRASSPSRAPIADEAARGRWVPHDRVDARRPLLPRLRAAPRRVGARSPRRARAPQDRGARLPRDREMRDVAPGRARLLGRGRAPLRQRRRAPSRSRARPAPSSRPARRACSTRRRSTSRSTTRYVDVGDLAARATRWSAAIAAARAPPQGPRGHAVRALVPARPARTTRRSSRRRRPTAASRRRSSGYSRSGRVSGG